MEIITTAESRKTIVKAVAGHLEENSVYLGPPTFAYQVGCATIDREGRVIVENVALGEEIREMLIRNGLAKGDIDEMKITSTTIEVPLDDMDVQGIKNILNMLHSKQYLINRSIGTEGFRVSPAVVVALETGEFATAEEAIAKVEETAGYGRGFHFTSNGIAFTGFPFTTDAVQVKAYAELAAMMVAYAKGHKHIRPTETIAENEKYYMRIWLVRLGLGGKGAKETRHQLLKNLNGHTAFRTDVEKERWQERQKARLEAKKAATATNTADTTTKEPDDEAENEDNG